MARIEHCIKAQGRLFLLSSCPLQALHSSLVTCSSQVVEPEIATTACLH